MQTQVQMRQQPRMKTPLQMKVEVEAFLPQIPASLAVRTCQVKKATGKHCTLVSLQKYARELFTKKYNTQFESLPPAYQSEINGMVADAYYGMKEARM